MKSNLLLTFVIFGLFITMTSCNKEKPSPYPYTEQYEGTCSWLSFRNQVETKGSGWDTITITTRVDSIFINGCHGYGFANSGDDNSAQISFYFSAAGGTWKEEFTRSDNTLTCNYSFGNSFYSSSGFKGTKL